MKACNLHYVSKPLMSIKTPPELAIPLTEHVGRPFSSCCFVDEMPNVFTDTTQKNKQKKNTHKKENQSAITGTLLLK